MHDRLVDNNLASTLAYPCSNATGYIIVIAIGTLNCLQLMLINWQFANLWGKIVCG